jgi:hypothetical protein
MRPVYHMSEAFAHPEHASTWVAAIGGDPPDWERFLAGYGAGVDAPFANCWEPICRALGVPVPDRPFPHENSTASYLQRAEVRARNDEARARGRR